MTVCLYFCKQQYYTWFIVSKMAIAPPLGIAALGSGEAEVINIIITYAVSQIPGLSVSLDSGMKMLFS